LFSGKALDLMSERGLNPDAVEDAITSGEVYPDDHLPKNGWNLYIIKRIWRSLLVVIVDADGRVVCVI
jgi:hypothetical protein